MYLSIKNNIICNVLCRSTINRNSTCTFLLHSYSIPHIGRAQLGSEEEEEFVMLPSFSALHTAIGKQKTINAQVSQCARTAHFCPGYVCVVIVYLSNVFLLLFRWLRSEIIPIPMRTSREWFAVLSLTMERLTSSWRTWQKWWRWKQYDSACVCVSTVIHVPCCLQHFGVVISRSLCLNQALTSWWTAQSYWRKTHILWPQSLSLTPTWLLSSMWSPA